MIGFKALGKSIHSIITDLIEMEKEPGEAWKMRKGISRKNANASICDSILRDVHKL